MKNELLRYAKALGGAAAAFIGSIITALVAKPGEPTWADLGLMDWLTAVAFALAALGLTAVVPKGDELVRRDRAGVLRAGPAARQATDTRLDADARLRDLMR
jgi:hypothetical protein